MIKLNPVKRMLYSSKFYFICLLKPYTFKRKFILRSSITSFLYEWKLMISHLNFNLVCIQTECCMYYYVSFLLNMIFHSWFDFHFSRKINFAWDSPVVDGDRVFIHVKLVTQTQITIELIRICKQYNNFHY